MKIFYTKHFIKQYKKLTPSLKKKTKLSINKFQKNPKNKTLKAHKLSGQLSGFYSFSVDYRYRVVFEIDKKNNQIILLKVGGHQIYQ
ncbi:type II toxin-antitoxin system mRNA interferase toxin, RelE/StbE family [Candidatus Parcubacteria bacterium]|nr:type II toxin-antitoxin system mRNA interferase toxin, RelE/StbE family [Candidatus Parcubacteria bacterium]